jgi:hypothetical protein
MIRRAKHGPVWPLACPLVSIYFTPSPASAAFFPAHAPSYFLLFGPHRKEASGCTLPTANLHGLATRFAFIIGVTGRLILHVAYYCVRAQYIEVVDRLLFYTRHTHNGRPRVLIRTGIWRRQGL